MSNDNQKNNSSKAKRTVLLVGSDLTSAKIESLLENNGWEVSLVETQEAFNSAIQNDNFSVVVTVFSDDQEMLRSIEYHALSEYVTKWIAVIPNDGWLKRHANLRFSKVFYDYHRVPLQNERFLDTVGHAYGMATLAQTELETTSQHRILSVESSVDEIIGKSPKIVELKRKIALVAKQNLTVLLSGESGSGRELVARNIHLQSKRISSPFVTINCASLPEEHMLTELFGHEQGVKSDKRVIGKIESAHTGTLFLDKVNEMPLSMQNSLLSFLDKRKIQRLGSTTEIAIDCALILSVTPDLIQAVENGSFRKDLYHLINVLPINVPSLREHPSDIPLLAEHYLKRFSFGNPDKYFASECLQLMQSYAWPGNVRELINKVKQAALFTQDNTILSSNIGLDNVSINNIIDLNTARQLAEKKAIFDALESTGNNHTLAAAKLGISRTSLYRLLAKLEEHST